MIAKMFAQTLFSFGVMGALLFLSAGTLDWPAAWGFLLGMIVFGLWAGLSLARHDPALVKERTSSLIQKDQPFADKIFVGTLLVTMMGWLVLIGFDAVRFAWSHVPLWVQCLGVLLLLVGGWIADRALRQNSFAAAVVKVQKERAQTVISTGLYGFVRHPMYFGMMFVLLGIPLLLGSWWGLAVSFILILLFCVRILLEEKALRTGLEGYEAYTAQVRYRLIPGIW